MVDQRPFSLVIGDIDAEEPPGVPRIDLGLRLLIGDERLLGMLDPEGMAARGAHDHLLRRSDEVVV